MYTPQALQIDRLLATHPPHPRNAFEWRAHFAEFPALDPRLRRGHVQSPAARRAAVSAPAAGTGYRVQGTAARRAAVSAPPSEAEAEEPDATDVVTRARTTRTREAEGEGEGEAGEAARRVARNFLVGFGSIIQTSSRRLSDPAAVDAAPCRVSAAFGYVREWNFQAATAQICALGLRKASPGEVGATFNGVLFPAPDDMSEFDARENGYQRVPVPVEMVELLSWQTLPADANVYIYVPYAPDVVARYGVDESTGLPRCSGPVPPEGLDLATEGSGIGLRPPSATHPILQVGDR